MSEIVNKIVTGELPDVAKDIELAVECFKEKQEQIKNIFQALQMGNSQAERNIKTQDLEKALEARERLTSRIEEYVLQHPEANIALATCGAASDRALSAFHGFHLLVIDEAAQVRPEEALQAVRQLGTQECQVVLCGDDKQLGPMARGLGTAGDEASISVFQELRRLNVQRWR